MQVLDTPSGINTHSDSSSDHGSVDQYTEMSNLETVTDQTSMLMGDEGFLGDVDEPALIHDMREICDLLDNIREGASQLYELLSRFKSRACESVKLIVNEQDLLSACEKITKKMQKLKQAILSVKPSEENIKAYENDKAAKPAKLVEFEERHAESSEVIFANAQRFVSAALADDKPWTEKECEQKWADINDNFEWQTAHTLQHVLEEWGDMAKDDVIAEDPG